MDVGTTSNDRPAAQALNGTSIIREIKASQIGFVVSVPDITTSEGLLRPLVRAREIEIRDVPAASHDGGDSIYFTVPTNKSIPAILQATSHYSSHWNGHSQRLCPFGPHLRSL